MSAGRTLNDDVIAFGPFELFVSERRLENRGLSVKIGGRAFDILIALANQAGEVVSNEELAARVWPDTSVEESGLRVHIARLRKAIGDGQDGARYVTNVPGRGYCLVASVSRSNASVPSTIPPRVTADRRHNVPSPLARIVGREAAINEISEQLWGTRFVSVVGPGGMGKTTVAVVVAHALVSDFKGDVCFVDLGSLTDASQVAGSVASALGLAPLIDESTSSVVAFLRDRRTLIVLDSCEHVVGTAAALAERIFHDAPQAFIMTTSREPLRVDGEHVHRLLPLDSPPPGHCTTAEEVITFPAVQLFIERATALGARLTLADDDAPVVAEICRRLDGIPLAIEVAAARVDAYGIRGTADLLEHRFKLLWQGRRTAVSRHQTLSAMLDWSYDLLSALERTVLRRLSIFAGRFSLEAAAAVAGDLDVDDERAIDILGGLVQKSLVSVDVSHAAARYRLLDTTRSYARGRLDEANEHDMTARRHAEYMCNVLEADGPVVERAHPIAEHVDNVRAALTWSFSETGDTPLGAALAAASVPMFMDLSLLAQCQRKVELAVATLDDADRGTLREMHLQAALGVSLLFTRGSSPEVQTALTRSLSLADEIGDPYQQLRLLGALHLVLLRRGEFPEALTIGERSEGVAKRLADPGARSLSDWMIGSCHHFIGDQSETERRCRSALTRPPMSRRMGMMEIATSQRERALIGLVRALWLLGRAEEAMRVARQVLRETTETGRPATVATSFVLTSAVFRWSGDLNAAEEIVERQVAYVKKHSLGPYHEAVGLGLQGELLVDRGVAGDGVELLRRSMQGLRAMHNELLPSVFATALAAGLAAVGQVTDALETIERAMAATAQNGALLNLPEMLRMKGHLLTTMPVPDEAEAERCLLAALDCARAQGAIAWELRAATTAARLWRRQGRRAEAREVLMAIYDRFTEGFQTSDLLAAKRLLAEL